MENGWKSVTDTITITMQNTAHRNRMDSNLGGHQREITVRLPSKNLHQSPNTAHQSTAQSPSTARQNTAPSPNTVHLSTALSPSMERPNPINHQRLITDLPSPNTAHQSPNTVHLNTAPSPSMARQKPNTVQRPLTRLPLIQRPLTVL